MIEKNYSFLIKALVLLLPVVVLASCASQPTLPAAAAAPTVVITDTGGFADAIAAVAEAARPSVVHIDITATIAQQAPQFGPYGFYSGPPSTSKVPVRALGSGVLLDQAGHIITNNHVVENADTISVQFIDGSVLKARVVGTDPSTDLAVIQVDNAKGGKVAQLGDSEALKVGEWVVAIGSPRGLDWTVTAGIVSATHRTNVGSQAPTGLEDFIQTDTAINPGNSGGPLLNLNGEVVGLNSMIISQSQGSEGLGFAIPSSLVKSIAESLIRDGKVIRGDLGMSYQDVDSSVIKALKLPAGTTGVVVMEVLPLGPAEAAGLKQDDVITQFIGQKVGTALELQKAVMATRPGTVVALAVLRAGKTLKVDVTVGDQFTLAQQVAAHPDYELLGLKVTGVTDAMAKQLSLSRTIGVAVTEVVPGSPADNASLIAGDLIFRVGTVDVNDPSQFSAAIGDAIQAGSVVLLIRDAQSGRLGYLEVPLQ